jgi:hypothetical protein
MATDGVKIIDGDTAHDTYWSIMDLYDSGATSETIKTQIPFPPSDFYNDFDYEIYTTAYALAMWEIGFITEDIIDEVRKVIDTGACVKIWTEEHDAKRGKQRQKELDKLWIKITSENIKVRKRKKYKEIDKFLFDINDVLAFQFSDHNYYAIILLSIMQYRGECNYRFGRILFQSGTTPSEHDIKDSIIIGENFGPETTEIDHRDLINIKDKFIKVCSLALLDKCKEDWWGSRGGAATFEDLVREFKYFNKDKNRIYSDGFYIRNLLKN